jgi:hypothetical protein
MSKDFPKYRKNAGPLSTGSNTFLGSTLKMETLSPFETPLSIYEPKGLFVPGIPETSPTTQP